MKSYLIVTLGLIVKNVFGQLVTNGIIDPTAAFTNINTKGYGTHFIIDEGVMAIGTAETIPGSGQNVLLSYEYNAGSYNTNPQFLTSAGTNSGYAIGYGNGWVITGGGTSDNPEWWKYEGGAWVKKFEITGFPTDCPAEITGQLSYTKMEFPLKHCKTVQLDKFASRALIIPQNGWARVYRKNTDTNWVHEVDVHSTTFGYNNLYVFSSVFCGPSHEFILWGGQVSPAEVPVYARTGTTWSNNQTVPIPVSPNAATDDAFVAYDMLCSPSGTAAIVGVPNDEDVVTNGIYPGSAHIMELNNGVWSVVATFRDGGDNSRYGSRVAISGRWAAVAEPRWIKAGVSGSNHGRVHVYYKNEDTDIWEYKNYIISNDVVTQDYFGRSLWITSDGTIYIGGNVNTINSFTAAGQIHTLQQIPPTPAPTPAPTPNPYIVVGTASVIYNVKNGTARQQVAKTTITDVKNKYSDPSSLSIRVKSTETSYNPLTTYQQVNNKTLYEESYAKARGCWPECTATVVSVGGNRLLSGTGLRQLNTDVIEIEIVFDLTESAYNNLVTSGNNLDDPQFLTDLATELGVNEGDIAITIVGGEIILDISLIAEVTTEPTGADSLLAIQEIQSSLNNATNVLVTELGEPSDSVTTVTLDLCSNRDCNGFGDATAAGTDGNGCNTETGACVCLNDRWGINCETACACQNGGTCANSYCHCIYPYYGFKCHLNKTTDCSACFA